MKIGFIFVLYKTPESEVKRLKKEVKDLKFTDYKIYFVDNSENGHGYGQGANDGVKKAQKDDCDLFVVANPDISISRLTSGHLLEAGRYFDIWGLAMRQDGKIYYGGELDKLRMSGGLIGKKPAKRF